MASTCKLAGCLGCKRFITATVSYCHTRPSYKVAPLLRHVTSFPAAQPRARRVQIKAVLLTLMQALFNHSPHNRRWP